MSRYVILDFHELMNYPPNLKLDTHGLSLIAVFVFLFTDLKEQIEWPALIICKLPRYKNEQKYQEFVTKGFFEKFSSQEEFDNLENEAFEKDIKSTIHAVTIGGSNLLFKFSPLEGGHLKDN